MWKQFHLNFLILSALLFQEIWASIEESKNSSDLHIRRKRLIDRTPHGNKPVSIRQVPYIVNIKANGASICGGSILSPKIVLTAAHCFLLHPALCKHCTPVVVYTILSGSEHRNRGIEHSIKKRISHPNFKPPDYVSDLALVIIYPPIDLVHSPNRRIPLYNEPIHPKDLGTFSGWGCTEVKPKIVFPSELRSIRVPVISFSECESFYQKYVRNFKLRAENICTHDKSRQKASCGADSGSPLVFHGQLAGVMSGSYGPIPGVFPDVFMDLAHPNNRIWLTLTLLHLRK